jgi:hypothetical protein
LTSKIGKEQIEVELIEGGTFKAVLPNKPTSVTVNNEIWPFTYNEKMLTIEMDTNIKEKKTIIIK